LLRILIAGFVTVPGPDRAGVQMRHVLRALAGDASVDVLVLRAGDQPYVERMGNARILRVPVQDEDPAAQINSFRRALHRQLDGAEYDVVHFRDGWSGIPVLEQRERLRYATVFDAARGPFSDPPPTGVGLAAELARDEEACLLAADLVLVGHEAARRFASSRGRPRRIHVVPPGVDVDQFDWDTAPPAGQARVVHVGTLAPGRGVRILLRAMLDVVRRVDARLVLAGAATPAFARTLRAAIADLGLTGRVDLVGPIDHDRIPALLATATVCVAPAAAELGQRATALYPTKLLEYMACRRAVVAPRRGSVALLVEEGTHGLLFSPGDPQDLAAKLVRLVDDAALRGQLATAGYQLVRAQFTASATRRNLRAAYRALAATPEWRERFAAAQATADDAIATEELAEAELVETGSMPGMVVDTAAAIDSGPIGTGDETSVDLRSPDARPALGRGDDWVVEDTAQRRPVAPAWAEADDEDEGTPVDVRRAPSVTPPVEARFVAGEVEIPPAGEVGSFTAVSGLLGNRSDRGDDTPTPAPRRRARRQS